MKLINGELLSEDECYQKHYRLIYKTLRPFLPTAKNVGMDQEDLISEGKIGFLKAYRRFDSSLGYRFSSYAIRTIKFEALRFIRDKGKIVRFPRTAIELANKINVAGLEGCTEKEIAEKMNVPAKDVEIAMLSRMDVDSVDQTVFDENEKVTLLDRLGSEADYSVVFVNDFIDRLNPDEQTIIDMRMKGFQQRIISEKLGVSQVWISRQLKQIGERYLEQVGS
ncbi:sigma-70 family RNA polymerase sigma factor [Virgibacillus oceani]